MMATSRVPGAWTSWWVPPTIDSWPAEASPGLEDKETLVNPSRLARQPRGVRDPSLSSAGGLMLVGGPPFHGKSVLAAHLADMLPFAQKLEVVDNLAGKDEHWLPEGVTGQLRHKPLRSMLEAAVSVWVRSSPRPIVIVSARAGSRAARRLAHRTAVSAGMKFLFVEAFSQTVRTFERLSALMLPKDELLRVMQRYERAVNQYERVEGDEMKSLPAVRLKAVLSDVEAAGRTVLERWAGV